MCNQASNLVARLITARNSAGLTQRELVTELRTANVEVSQPYLALVESGERQWPDERLRTAIDICERIADERARQQSQMRNIIDRLHRNDAWGFPVPTEVQR